MMTVRLLFADRDFDAARTPAWGMERTMHDLGMDAVVDAMGAGDVSVAAACRAVLLQPLAQATQVAYRQEALADALRDPEGVRRLFAVAQGAVARSGQDPQVLGFSPAVEDLGRYAGALRELAAASRGKWQSVAFRRLAEEVGQVLDERYLGQVDELVAELSSGRATLAAVRLGPTCAGTDYALCSPPRRGDWLRWKVSAGVVEATDADARLELAHASVLPGLRGALCDLRRFFVVLRDELGFYVGCLNFLRAAREAGVATCMPSVVDAMDLGSPRRSWQGLVPWRGDASGDKDHGGARHPAAAQSAHAPAPSSGEGRQTLVWMVTGDPGTGKTALLQAMGQAQLMAQCGMPVCAESLSTTVRTAILTCGSFDASPASGGAAGVDRELDGIRDVVDHLVPGSLALWDEPLDGVDEGEASVICRELARGLAQAGVEAVFSTRLPDFAGAFLAHRHARYLRCERDEDGSCRVVAGRPKADHALADAFAEVFGQSLPS